MVTKSICLIALLGVASNSFGMTEFQAEAYKFGWQGGTDAVKSLFKTSSPVITNTDSGLVTAGGLVKTISIGGLKFGLKSIKNACESSPIAMLSLFLSGGAGVIAYKIHRNIQETKEAAQRSEMHAKQAAENSDKAVKEALKNREILEEHTRLHKQHIEEQKKTQKMIESVDQKIKGLTKEQQEQKKLVLQVLQNQKEASDDSKKEFERLHKENKQHVDLLQQVGTNVTSVQTQISGVCEQIEQPGFVL